MRPPLYETLLCVGIGTDSKTCTYVCAGFQGHTKLLVCTTCLTEKEIVFENYCAIMIITVLFIHSPDALFIAHVSLLMTSLFKGVYWIMLST